MNFLLQGIPGSGKTFATMTFPEPVTIFLIENRKTFYSEVKQRFFPNRLVTLVDCHVSMGSKKWLAPTDAVATFEKFQQEFDNVDFETCGTIVVDDVGLLRKHGGEVYKKAHNKKTVPTELGWGWVNSEIRYYILGAMNACSMNGKICVVTTTMKDNYMVVNGESVKAGLIPDIIREIEAGVDFQIEMQANEKLHRHMAKIIKSPYGKAMYDVTGTSLYDIINEAR